jgi:hypothetical protein
MKPPPWLRQPWRRGANNFAVRREHSRLVRPCGPEERLGEETTDGRGQPAMSVARGSAAGNENGPPRLHQTRGGP